MGCGRHAFAKEDEDRVSRARVQSCGRTTAVERRGRLPRAAAVVRAREGHERIVRARGAVTFAESDDRVVFCDDQ